MNRRNLKIERLAVLKNHKGAPNFEHVLVYFDQKKCCWDDAELFYRFYDNINWQNKNGSKINWKTAANNWIWQKQQEQTELQQAFKSKIKRLQQIIEVADRLKVRYR